MPDSRVVQPRQPQDALALPGEFVRRLCEVFAIKWQLQSIRRLLPITVFENDFRRPFHQQSRLAISSLIERRHEPMFRFERDCVEPGIPRLLDLPRHPQLVRKRVERPFGRIALHPPVTLLLEQLRIIAEQ
jgi:hypothetical protein